MHLVAKLRLTQNKPELETYYEDHKQQFLRSSLLLQDNSLTAPQEAMQ